MNVPVGGISFKAVIDTSGLRSEVAKVNQLLARETLRLRVQLDTSAADKELSRIRGAIALQAPARVAASVPVAPQSGFARDFDSALQRQSRDAGLLAREFDKTAIAIERVANQTARIQFRQQEQQAAALARELLKTEAAATRTQQRAAQISFARQQKEVEGFAKEFDRAAAAQQRLQQQTARDQNILGGAKFSDKEIKNVEAALKRVNAETQKTDQVAALLRQKYGLADAEARKLAGTLGNVGQQSQGLSSTLDKFGNSFIARFFGAQAAIQALQAAVAGIVGTFAEASGSFREFEANLLSFQSKSIGVEVDMEGLADEIDRVAKITSQSPGSLSAAANELVSLGVDATEVEGRLDALAKASDVLGETPIELARAFEAGLKAYKDYGVGVEEVSDTVAQAIATTGVKDANEFGQLFSKASAPAATLGVTIQELVSLFATFREAGALPQVSSTAIETALQRIAAKRDELLKEGVELEFKENGGLNLEQTLINVQERIQDLAPTEQLSFLSKIFGEAVGSDLLLLLSRIGDAYKDTEAKIGQFDGAVQRSYEIVSQGTDFQAGIVTGGVESALKTLGETLNPVEKGFIELQQAILNSATVDLSPLTASAEQLGTALGKNPELAEQLSAAVSDLAQTAVNALVQILDGFTVLVSNQNAIDQFAMGIKGIGNALEVVGDAISFALAFADGLADVNDALLKLPIAGDALRGAIEQPLNPFGGLLQGALDDILSFLNGIRKAVGDFLSEIPLIGDGFRAVADPVGALFDAIEARIGPIGERVELLIERIKAAAGVRETIGSDIGGSAGKGLEAGIAALDKFATVAAETREKVNGGEAIGPTFKTPQEGLGATDALARFRTEQDNLINEINQRDAEAQVTLTNKGADPEAFVAQERKTLQARVKAREEFVARIKELQSRPSNTVAENLALEKSLAEAESQLAADRLSVAKNFQQSRQQILDNLQRDNQESVAELERQTAEAAAALAETPLSDRDRATAEANAEQQALQQRIDNRQKFLDQLKAQEAKGGLSAEQARALGGQIIAVETEIFGQRVQLAQSLEAERKRIAEQGFSDQLTALNQFKQQEELISRGQTTGLNDQGRLIEADTAVVSARNQLDQARLGTALAIAKAEADTATTTRGALAAQRDINAAQLEVLNGQIEATAAEFAAKRQSLGITEQLQRIEAQRAIQAAEIAAIEADIAVRRAKVAGATQQEINGLQRIADLTLEQVDSTRKSAAVTDQVLAAKREELGLQEQLSAEQIRQNNLAEQGNRIADARRGIISALAAESSTPVEDSLATIDRIEEKFKDAQKAGLFRGENIKGDTRDVERALKSGNDRKLFELAQQGNPVIDQLLNAAGRSDITGLVEADKELRLAKAVDDGNAAIVQRLDTLIEQGIGSRIEQLIVQTPDPVADTSRIVNDVANMQTAGVNA